MAHRPSTPPVENLATSAYTVPTATPESDGTLEWSQTTIVVAEVSADGTAGIGYSYANGATARLIDSALKPVVVDQSALDVAAIRQRMLERIRNLGRPGIASMAIAAVDNALWDLKARLLGVAAADLLTSLAGQCCNVAVVMDYSKYLNRLIELDPAKKRARVQPGIVLDWVRQAAERHHLTFVPDPATHNHNTLGGMIGNKTTGPRQV